MTKFKAHALKIPMIVAVLASSLIVSGMNLAEAVPMGAKQFGSKTLAKMKAGEISQETEKTSDKKITYPKNHKGTQSELKNEQIKLEKKLSEQQKAFVKMQKLFHKNPYAKTPYS